MVFQERKVKKGYSYTVTDVFGDITLISSVRLTGELLDDLVALLLRQKNNASKLEGTVKHTDGVVSYVFNRAPLWSEDDENEVCENLPTSTQKQVAVFTAIRRLLILPYDWCKRFVVAFRTAWKKTKK